METVAKESDAIWGKGFWALEMGCLCLVSGKISVAIETIDEAIDDLEAAGWHPEVAQAHLYLASAYHSAGEDENVIRHLYEASQTAAKMDSLHPLVIAGREIKETLELATDTPNVGEFVSRLINTIEQFDRELPRLRRLIREQDDQTPISPPCLDIQAFGELGVKLNGELVTRPEWANQRKVRELFYLLLAHPKGLTKEAIGDALWPDSEPHRIPKQFNNAIYRLRRALGKETVSFNQRCGRYRFNWGMDYRYDVERFKTKLKHARSAKNPEKKIAAYKDAIEMYRGPYLQSVEGIWAIPIREELQKAYVETNLVSAEFHFQKSDYEKTWECCCRILLEDPCHEAAHCLAMRVHAARGNRSEVVQQYQRCNQHLQSHLDLAPSPETEDLFKQLVGK